VVRAVWELAWDPAHSPASWEAREQIERAVQAAFFAALRSGCEHLVPPPPLRVVGRHRRFRQARDHLAAHLHDPVYLSDLCRATGLCPRALENLFQDFLGLSPMAYLRHLRLHQARRALLRSAPASGVVKQTAPAWGFWHLGHFARDYHALFGESPIATLRR
jgi:AraC family ethanolamine operon transcriptional activator